MPAITRPVDPLVGFNFSLTVSGKITGYFTEVSGIGSEHEVTEHKTTTNKGRELVSKIPGRLKWGDVTLKRGITSTMDIWTWRQEVVDGKVAKARTNCTIQMFDRTYSKIIAEWTFDNAWPSKVSGPEPKSDSNDVGIEEVVIVHEGFRRVK